MSSVNAEIVSVELLAGAYVTITMLSSFDNYLSLYQPGCIHATSNDDRSGSDRNALITYSVPASGAYFIEASSYAYGATGSFTLSVY